MRSTLAALLILALTLVACSDDDGPRVADPTEIGLQIVSGDGQTAPVRPAGGATTAALAPTAEIPEHILPEPLKARVVVIDPEPQAGLTGPSAVVLPSDLDVTFRVIQPADPFGRDCGASFLDGARPDDDGYVTTFWERGTIADVECRMEVRLVVDGQPRVDTVFVATFEPGPAVPMELAAASGNVLSPYYIPDRLVPSDEHGNAVPFTLDIQDHPTVVLAGESGDDARTLVLAVSEDACGIARVIVADTTAAIMRVTTDQTGVLYVLSYPAHWPSEYHECPTPRSQP